MIDPNKDYTAAVENLTATTDIFGNTLAIGDIVHSFDNPLITGSGKIFGLDTDIATERVSYIEAEVVAIGEAVIEGCPRYTLRIVKDVAFCDGQDYSRPERTGRCVYPPLNGVRSTLNGRCFGVVKLAA